MFEVNQLHLANKRKQGRIQDFLKGGLEILKKGVWSAAPEAIGC